MNLVERWFRDLTDRRLRRGVFCSVPALIEAIEDYIEHHNDTDKGFRWTAKADEILGRKFAAHEPPSIKPHQSESLH